MRLDHLRLLFTMCRSAILDSLKKEEIAKECYMRRLNDLNERLKILDTDQVRIIGDTICFLAQGVGELPLLIFETVK